MNSTNEDECHPNRNPLKIMFDILERCVEPKSQTSVIYNVSVSYLFNIQKPLVMWDSRGIEK